MTLALAQEPWFLAGWSRHISPSSFGRVNACVRSEAMPHAFEESAYAAKGTIAHAFLANCQNYGRDRALSMAPVEESYWLQMLDLERLPAFDQEAYAAEAAIAYHPMTGAARLLGYNLTRQQARAKAHDDELVGIMDVLGETDDAAVVHDYKTGWGYIEPAATNWQLKSYGLFGARLLGKTRVVYSVIRVRDNGQTWFDRAEMDELELLAHEEALRQLVLRRERVRQDVRAGAWEQVPAFVQGEHCKYCPALPFCPAKVHGLKELVKRDADNGPPSGHLTPDEAAVAWQAVQQARKTLDRWDAVLRDYARQTPIPLGNGEVLGERTTTSERIVPEKARAPMERKYGAVGAAAVSQATVIEASITKKDFRKALKDLVLDTLPPDHQKITWLERDALKVLREGGAITTSVKRSVTEHVPLKQLEGGATPELPAGEEAA